MTKQANVGAVVGQGMLGGALVSLGVLDDAVMEHLPPGEPSQMEYGDVPLAPLMWMDDFISSTDTIEKARLINTKVDFLIKQRSLTLNEEKSICLIIGSKKQKKEATKVLLAQPLTCGNFVTEEKQQEKWLGQILSSAGLADSVYQTVLAREGKTRYSLRIAPINDALVRLPGCKAYKNKPYTTLLTLYGP